jgi:nitrate/nitrite transporter NarK
MSAVAGGAAKAAPAVKTQQWSVAISSTFAFTVCFAVWMMFGVIGVPIQKELGLNATQFGLLTATPVLTGSLIRVPLGMWTDKFGGRIVFFALMLSTVIPIWLITYATQFWHFLVLGLFVGLAGGSFSVGTPYVARWFDKSQQGFAMGVFGAGNSGAALNKFIAPVLLVAFGWMIVPKVYAVAMLITAILFWMFSLQRPETLGRFAHHLAPATPGAQRPEGLEVLPVLLDRVRRLCRALALDGAVLRWRVRARHSRRRAACGRLLAAWRRIARHGRLVLRQVRARIASPGG